MSTLKQKLDAMDEERYKANPLCIWHHDADGIVYSDPCQELAVVELELNAGLNWGQYCGYHLRKYVNSTGMVQKVRPIGSKSTRLDTSDYDEELDRERMKLGLPVLSNSREKLRQPEFGQPWEQ